MHGCGARFCHILDVKVKLAWVLPATLIEERFICRVLPVCVAVQGYVSQTYAIEEFVSPLQADAPLPLSAECRRHVY